MVPRGRSLFWVLATGLITVVLATLWRLPPVVASHFDGAGVPNGWSSRAGYALVLIAVGVLLPLGITGLVHALTREGPQRLNIPARDYWTLPGNGEEAVRRVRGYLWWLGCIMAGTAIAIHGLVLAAHTHRPPRLRTPGLLVVLATMALALGGWIAGWYRLLRRPRAP